MRRRQNDISDEAFGLLADLIGGKSMVLMNTSVSARKMAYVADGKVIDNDVVRELFDICAIWPERFDDLDRVPIGVTKAGYAYVHSLTDA